MPSEAKREFLRNLGQRSPRLRKLEGSQSLYEVGDGGARLYIRYSKVHPDGRTFYGLRQEDLRALAGHRSLICFLWDSQREPLLVPYSQYEEVFHSVAPASDGQYKAQVYLQGEGTELYIAQAGRFTVEAHIGWGELETLLHPSAVLSMPLLSHPQVQTILGALGALKSYDVWIPPADVGGLDWSVAEQFGCRTELPARYEAAMQALQEVDVIWLGRGSSELRALYEVEHSTPIYSALLRLNDVHLATAGGQPTYAVVAEGTKRSAFVRQVNRPTFRASGLSRLCTFLEYRDVFEWYVRATGRQEVTGGQGAL
jgi:hypothetical protein